MKVKISLILFAGLAFCSGAAAMTDNNPYQTIVTRNVFGLKDPPPPATVEPVKPPTPKLTLTGITTFGKTRALLKALPKPGEQPNGGQSFILGEGERDGEVQVVSIDPALGKVTLNLGGEAVIIGFQDNSRSSGAAMGTSAAPLSGSPGAFPPQQFATAGVPQRGGAMGTIAAPAAGSPGAFLPQRYVMAGNPQPQANQVAQIGQITQADGAAAPAATAAAQAQDQTGLAFQQTSTPSFQAGSSENPYVRGKAIQHVGFDPTPGAVQTRRPFPTRSLRGRGFAAYEALSPPDPAADAPAQPSPQ